MRMWRRLVLFLTLGIVCLAATPALAHANLARSEPAANAILAEAPSQLRLWFTERPEPRFSEIQLLDQQGQPVAGVGDVQVDSTDPNLLTVTLPKLDPGVYTVNWKALSAADGHTTVGAYAFAVGGTQGGNGKLKPFIAGSLGSSSTPTLPGVVARWTGFLALALLTGGFAFMPLVYRPAQLKPVNRPRGASGVAFSHASGLIWVLRAGIGLLLISTLVGAALQAASAQSDLFALLTVTRYGALFWIRLLLTILLGLLLAFRESRWWRANWASAFWWVGLALTAGVLLTTSLGSHAEASAAWLSLVADWLHLLSMGVWLGGLVALFLTLRWLGGQNQPQSAALISRFSQVATICITLLSVSGAFRAFYEVGVFSNLVDTPYGAVLLGKLILLVPILGVAAFNLLMVERIHQTANPVQAIRRTVRIEILFAVLILGMTGILTSLPPAREAFGAGQVVRGEADDLRILVAINPGNPGLNTFDIYVKDSLNRPIPEARKVALNIDMTGHPMGIQEAVAEQVEPGHYAVSGGYTSMIGLWEIEVIVRRDGRDDARLKLNLPLLSLTRPQPGLTIVSPSNLLVGLELLAAGVLLLLAAPRLDAARRGTGMIARLLAGIIVILCLFAFLNALNAGENGALALRNPIPADAASLGRGQKIYQANCVACHGATGAGDGPVAASLNPKPANLQIHMNDGHPDGLLYNWITNGVNGSAMPAFATTLTEPERWDVLNYIRSLARPR